MTSSPNKVLVAGRLLQKPELRKAANGAPMTDLLVSVQKQTSHSPSLEQDSIHVVVWGSQAERCVEIFDQASSVLVEGKLQLDVWLTKEGQKKRALRVTAEHVHMLEKVVEGQEEALSKFTTKV